MNLTFVFQLSIRCVARFSVLLIAQQNSECISVRRNRRW